MVIGLVTNVLFSLVTSVLFSFAFWVSFNLLDVRAARDQINIGGLAYPPLPLHEPPPRPPSGYSQPASVCSSSTSFNGPFGGGVVSPQPHSSYYSGMTGPQQLNFFQEKARSVLLMESVTI